MREGMKMRAKCLLLGLLLLLAGIIHAQDIGVVLGKQFGFDPDFAANMRVEMIGQRLALAAGVPNASFHIFNNKELNAMALPDGRIYITSTMAHVVNDDELAFVLGHELTHIQKGHSKSQSQRATSGAILGAILVAVLGGSTSDIRTGADIAGSLTLGHYSRRDENSADAGGITLMTRAGYNPRRAADAMQRLIDKYGTGDANVPVLGWFATHPDTKSRKARMLETAVTLEKNPPPRLANADGVTLLLDPSAAHAADWVHNYLSIALLNESNGHAVLQPVFKAPVHAPQPVPAAAVPDGLTVPAPAVAAAENGKKNKDNEKEKDEPLPPVTIVDPQAPLTYELTLAFRQVPAARAASLQASKGTAVEATLHWKNLTTGFTGACTAVTQTTKTIPWMAAEELKDVDALQKLADGKADNIEGTLQADAVRRVVRIFAEVVKIGGPVDHGASVTLTFKDKELRVGDYLGIVRNNTLVAEVVIDTITAKTVTGTVLWGVHTVQKKDRIIRL